MSELEVGQRFRIIRIPTNGTVYMNDTFEPNKNYTEQPSSSNCKHGGDFISDYKNKIYHINFSTNPGVKIVGAFVITRVKESNRD